MTVEEDGVDLLRWKMNPLRFFSTDTDGGMGDVDIAVGTDIEDDAMADESELVCPGMGDVDGEGVS